MNNFKTLMLLTGLTLFFIVCGQMLAGPGGMVVAFVLAVGMNFVMYWYGDKIVLKQYNAEEITEEKAPKLHKVVGRLAEKAGIPKPAVYLVPESTPNAFATGRNPKNASIGVTKGILELLNEDELEAVIAHELSHVYNRDTLINVVAASLAGAISMLATMARWGAIFGMGGRGRDNNIIVLLVMSIVAPLAAMIIQMAISRSREYKADRSGAELCGKPMQLASALKKMEQAAERKPMQSGSQETAHLFIVNPFSGGNFQSLFSTHPSVEDRVSELEKIAKGL
ncbi:MAG: zinc metalloprotease HtpX [bacterium]